MTKLYVGNLGHSTGEKQIRELFSEAGPVTSVSLITDRDTGESRGFAFVEMEAEDDAQRAIGMMNGRVFEGSPLVVNVARPREDRQQRSPSRGPKRSGKRPRGRRY